MGDRASRDRAEWCLETSILSVCVSQGQEKEENLVPLGAGSGCDSFPNYQGGLGSFGYKTSVKGGRIRQDTRG